MFGGGAWKLGKDLNIPTSVAQQIIDASLLEFNGIREFHKKVASLVDAGQGIRTLTGRRRFVSLKERLKGKKPEDTKYTRKSIINEKVNVVCQSLAWDALALAAQKLRRKLIEKNMWGDSEGQAYISNAIYDELVIGSCKSVAIEVNEMARDCMENTLLVGVPMVSESLMDHVEEYKYGFENWSQAK